MCLPHCPTYGLAHNEAESPRGRIALMAAVARGQLETTSQLLGHIERCLSCRACEAMCPSQVAYGRLLRNGRELLRQRAPSLHRHPSLNAVLSIPERRRLLRGALRLFQLSGAKRAGEALHLFGTGSFGRLVRVLPPVPAAGPLPELTPAHGAERGRVALFAGCTGDLLERRLLHDATRLLSRLGYTVAAPATQGCCGALHLQQGEGARARELAANNLAAFAGTDTILTVASGCGALLHEYGELLETEEASSFASRIQDINTFLAGVTWPQGLPLRPLAERVLVHEPCSLRNVLRSAQGPYRMLRHIPDIDLQPLPGNERCCGAAGSHFLSEGATADLLRADKIAAAAHASARLLVSANIGCALHLSDGLRQAGLDLEVLHPVTLLVRQLGS